MISKHLIPTFFVEKFWKVSGLSWTQGGKQKRNTSRLNHPNALLQSLDLYFDKHLKYAPHHRMTWGLV